MIPQGDSAVHAPGAVPRYVDARLDGRQAFTDALREALIELPDSGVQQFWMVDEAFVGWPLEEPAVLQALNAWCRRPGRQAYMIGSDFGAVERGFPRFASWRRDYVHCLSAWRPDPSVVRGLDAMLVVGPRMVELLDREKWQSRLSTEPTAVRAGMERVGEWLQRCERAWPASPLGL